MVEDVEGLRIELDSATCAEELFGAEDTILPPEELLQYLQGKYDPLKRLCDESAVGGYLSEEDQETLDRLDTYYAEAQERVRLGLYGLPNFREARPIQAKKSIRVGANTYYLGDEIAKGERTKIYKAYAERNGSHLGEVVIKLVSTAEENQAATRELSNLAVLHGRAVPQWKHLPLVLDRFQAGERIGIVQRRIMGVSLSRLRQHAPHVDGLTQRHMSWMLDRLLSCIGYVHNRGMLHGCINSDHVMVRGRDRNAFIVGWGNAVQKPAITGERVDAVPDVFMAPEVCSHGEIGPWSDLYSIGKLCIWLTGGNPETDEIPEKVEPPLADFLRRLVRKDPYGRPADAWEVYDEHRVIRKRLWKAEYEHLPMPELD